MALLYLMPLIILLIFIGVLVRVLKRNRLAPASGDSGVLVYPGVSSSDEDVDEFLKKRYAMKGPFQWDLLSVDKWCVGSLYPGLNALTKGFNLTHNPESIYVHKNDAYELAALTANATRITFGVKGVRSYMHTRTKRDDIKAHVADGILTIVFNDEQLATIDLLNKTIVDAKGASLGTIDYEKKILGTPSGTKWEFSFPGKEKVVLTLNTWNNRSKDMRVLKKFNTLVSFDPSISREERVIVLMAMNLLRINYQIMAA